MELNLETRQKSTLLWTPDFFLYTEARNIQWKKKKASSTNSASLMECLHVEECK